MSTRPEKRKIINRKGFDYECPVDIEVLKILHEHAVMNNLDQEVVAADMSLETIKKIRKDVFKSIPDIIERCTDENIVDAEIIENE
jgi:hypothetical protein